MDQTIVSIILAATSLVVGVVAGRVFFAKNTKKQIEEANAQAANILKEAELRAETVKKEKQLEAKERFVQLKAEHEREVLERNRKVVDVENRLKQKEITVNQKEASLDKQVKENEAIKENLNRQIDVVNAKRTELEKHQEEHIRRLEKIANLSADDAREQLIESLKNEAQTRALSMQQDIIEDAKQKANKEARKIVIQTIQRTAAEQTIENTVTVFNLETDEGSGPRTDLDVDSRRRVSKVCIAGGPDIRHSEEFRGRSYGLNPAGSRRSVHRDEYVSGRLFEVEISLLRREREVHGDFVRHVRSFQI